MSNLALQNGCYAYDPTIGTSYGYIPSLAAGVAFVTLFTVSMVLHIGQSVYKRVWWGFVRSVYSI